ncbi:hypothetical protein OG777_05805 [Micromonospora peucetia]|uniref:hypothetical protein n=1 Tax=Micromonospora peucetia TaxID=47871 RepID=UPI002255D26D|nr:hypothetical protein [Micromonospora peucetia]MCX4386442.1 hypothetical protein [Micromonospora peucetia]
MLLPEGLCFAEEAVPRTGVAVRDGSTGGEPPAVRVPGRIAAARRPWPEDATSAEPEGDGR